VQEDAPYVLIFPAMQSSHTFGVADASKYCPASQAVQTVEPTLPGLDVLPSSHE